MFVTKLLGEIKTATFESHDHMLSELRAAHLAIASYAVPVLKKVSLKPEIATAKCVLTSAKALGYERRFTIPYLYKLALAHNYTHIDPLVAISAIMQMQIPAEVHYYVYMAPLVAESKRQVLTVGNTAFNNLGNYIGAFTEDSSVPYDSQVGFLMMEKQ